MVCKEARKETGVFSKTLVKLNYYFLQGLYCHQTGPGPNFAEEGISDTATTAVQSSVVIHDDLDVKL